MPGTDSVLSLILSSPKAASGEGCASFRGSACVGRDALNSEAMGAPVAALALDHGDEE